MTDYERLYKMFKPYAEDNGWGETYCSFEENRIILHTSDSYCNATLFFNEKGEFVGFVD